MSTTKKLLTEIFRPKRLEDVAMLSRVRNALRGGLDGKNLLLYSSSGGTGKTTITRILCQGYDTLYINASAERGIDIIRDKISSFAGTYSFNSDKPYKIIVLEEMDGLTLDSFNCLRSTMDEFPESVRFIGNCNNIDRIPEPVQSRFSCLQVSPISVDEEEELLKAYMENVSAILNLLNMTYTEENLKKFILAYFPNLRTIVTNIQLMAQSGIKDLSLANMGSSYNCSDLFEFICTNTDPVETYKLISLNYDNSVEDVMTAIARDFLDYVYATHPEVFANNGVLGNCAVVIADYMDKLTRAIDKTIVLLALVYQLERIIKGI